MMSIVENAPDLADTWTPSDEDWAWYLDTVYGDEYAENVMF